MYTRPKCFTSVYLMTYIFIAKMIRPLHKFLYISSPYQTGFGFLDSRQTRTGHRSLMWHHSTTSPRSPDMGLDPGSGCNPLLVEKMSQFSGKQDLVWKENFIPYRLNSKLFFSPNTVPDLRVSDGFSGGEITKDSFLVRALVEAPACPLAPGFWCLGLFASNGGRNSSTGR